MQGNAGMKPICHILTIDTNKTICKTWVEHEAEKAWRFHCQANRRTPDSLNARAQDMIGTMASGEIEIKGDSLAEAGTPAKRYITEVISDLPGMRERCNSNE